MGVYRIMEVIFPSILGRSLSHPFPKGFRIVTGTAEASGKCNFNNGHICAAEQFNAFAYPVLG